MFLLIVTELHNSEYLITNIIYFSELKFRISIFGPLVVSKDNQ